jgi:hypothetical protein
MEHLHTKKNEPCKPNTRTCVVQGKGRPKSRDDPVRKPKILPSFSAFLTMCWNTLRKEYLTVKMVKNYYKNFKVSIRGYGESLFPSMQISETFQDTAE